MTDTKISALASGGTIQTTDAVPVARSGANFQVTVGTSASKSASDNTKATLASVPASVAVGHIATFADEAGTLQDGGALGTASAQNVAFFAQAANNLSDLANVGTALTTILPSQSGNGGKFLATNGTAASWSTGASLGSIGAFRVNVLSDSQGAQSIYQPGDISLATYQAWVASTSYQQNEIVVANGYLFYNAGSTATSGSTMPTPAAPSDGTISWTIMPTTVNKFGNSILSMVEQISGGRAVWNMDDGYKGTNLGLVKVIPLTSGSGYVTPVITEINGAKVTVQTDGEGHITGYTVVSPGRATGYFNLTLTDAGGGTGATFSTVGDPSGAFGVFGCYVCSRHGGQPARRHGLRLRRHHRDVPDERSHREHALFHHHRGAEDHLRHDLRRQTRPRLRDRAAAAGLNYSQAMIESRVNDWARLYVAGVSTGYNTNGCRNIVIADSTGYTTDGTPWNANVNYPIGGLTQAAGSMTADGLHPSQRGTVILAHRSSGTLAARSCQRRRPIPRDPTPPTTATTRSRTRRATAWKRCPGRRTRPSSRASTLQ